MGCAPTWLRQVSPPASQNHLTTGLDWPWPQIVRQIYATGGDTHFRYCDWCQALGEPRARVHNIHHLL